MWAAAPASQTVQKCSPSRVLLVYCTLSCEPHLACADGSMRNRHGNQHCALEGAVCHSLEQSLSLLRGHVLTALQEIGHNQCLLNGLRLYPHPAVQTHHHLEREELLKIFHDLTLRWKEPAGRKKEQRFEKGWGCNFNIYGWKQLKCKHASILQQKRIMS